MSPATPDEGTKAVGALSVGTDTFFFKNCVKQSFLHLKAACVAEQDMYTLGNIDSDDFHL